MKHKFKPGDVVQYENKQYVVGGTYNVSDGSQTLFLVDGPTISDMVCTPCPKEDTDDAFSSFQERMRERYEAGKTTYGDVNWRNSIPHSFEDMKQEALDFANYAAMLYSKLCKLEQRLDEIHSVLGGEK